MNFPKVLVASIFSLFLTNALADVITAGPWNGTDYFGQNEGAGQVFTVGNRDVTFDSFQIFANAYNDLTFHASVYKYTGINTLDNPLIFETSQNVAKNPLDFVPVYFDMESVTLPANHRYIVYLTTSPYRETGNWVELYLQVRSWREVGQGDTNSSFMAQTNEEYPGIHKRTLDFVYLANVTPIGSPVPEPDTYALMFLGMGILAFVRRSRNIK